MRVRAVCPTCRKRIWTRHDGEFRAHGPRHAPCPGRPVAKDESDAGIVARTSPEDRVRLEHAEAMLARAERAEARIAALEAQLDAQKDSLLVVEQLQALLRTADSRVAKIEAQLADAVARTVEACRATHRRLGGVGPEGTLSHRIDLEMAALASRWPRYRLTQGMLRGLSGPLVERHEAAGTMTIATVQRVTYPIDWFELVDRDGANVQPRADELGEVPSASVRDGEAPAGEPAESSLWTTPAAEWTFEDRDLVDPNVTPEDIAAALAEDDEGPERSGEG